MVYKIINGSIPSGDQWMANAIAALKGVGRNTIRQLQDRSVSFSADGKEWAEAYVDADGRKNSVDTVNTSSNFNTNKYENLAPQDTESYTFPSGTSTTYPATATIDVTIATDGYLKTYTCGSGRFITAITIKKNGVTVATFSGYSASVTFTPSDYSELLESGDTMNLSITLNSSYAAEISSYSGTHFSYTSQRPMLSDSILYETYEIVSSSEITHNIPSGTFSSTISSSFGTALVSDWEDGANIQYKLMGGVATTTGTTSDPDSFTDASNAFDSNSNTYASKVAAVNTEVTLGKTFTSTYVVSVTTKVGALNNATSGKVLKLQSYNGSTWENEATLSNVYGTLTTETTSLEKNVQGLRVSFEDTYDGETFYLYDLYWTEYSGEDSGWLNYNEVSTFTAFTGEPIKCIVKLIPKTTSPTAGYPSIYGFWVGE